MPTQDALFGSSEPPQAGSATAGTGAGVASTVPLAERLRPQHIDEVVGQRHLLAPGRPLRVAF
ncbi:MAG: recombination factor protein RarA, partial [Rubrivivax sp.]|nr:recombination factor protein RarA [Rubrivivax sp.]